MLNLVHSDLVKYRIFKVSKDRSKGISLRTLTIMTNKGIWIALSVALVEKGKIVTPWLASLVVVD